MLYSNMGFRDNVKSLYDFLIREGYNTNYRIICSCNDYKKYYDVNLHNVSFVSNFKGIIKYFRAGYVFYCFGKIPIIPGKNQKVTQFWHGSPFKAPDEGMLKGHSWKRQYYTHVLSTSEHFKDFWSYAFSVPKNKIFVSGFPRNDVMFQSNKKYDFGDYNKLILWTPTFRKSSVMGYSDVKNDSELVPIVGFNDYQKLDLFLKEINTKLIIKLHPLQDLSQYKNTAFSNLVLLSHKEAMEKSIDLYRLMPQCDAMITDYSSIFYDFLLLDRPIGFTEDDVNDYGDTRGFAFDNPDDYKPGMKLKSIDDLYQFIDNVACGIDDYAKERKRVNSLANDYMDGGFCKRICKILGIENK